MNKEKCWSSDFSSRSENKKITKKLPFQFSKVMLYLNAREQKIRASSSGCFSRVNFKPGTNKKKHNIVLLLNCKSEGP